MMWVWIVPVIGFLIALAAWAYIWYMVLVVIPEIHKVQSNPANVQDWERNHRAARALAYHGILSATHNGKEYGFWRNGEWCSLYRSLPPHLR